MKIGGIEPEKEVVEPIKVDAVQKNIKTAEKTVESDNKKEYNLSEERLDGLLKKLNDHADTVDKGLKFEKDKDNGRWIVKVMNEETGEVIRQIPSKEIINIQKGIDEFMGVIINKLI